MDDRDQHKEAVKARVDLADWVIRDGVPLKGGPNEWKALCPFHSEGSPSFTVFHKDGQWAFKCFGCGAAGDVFEWVMRRKSLAFPQALRWVANAVGMAIPEPRVFQPAAVRAAVEPVRGVFDPEKFLPLAPGSKAFTYLTGQRGLPAELLARYSVGQTQDGEACAFAYKWQPAGARHPRFEFVKVLKVDRPEGKKVEWREPKGGRNILFGMLAVPASAPRLVICEGELDAVSWAHYGHAAVSVPGGAGYLGWIDVCWDWLQQFPRIAISFDEDRAGREKVLEVVQRLGIVRTDIVRLPEQPGTEEKP